MFVISDVCGVPDKEKTNTLITSMIHILHLSQKECNYVLCAVKVVHACLTMIFIFMTPTQFI
jgi:hypothetical protein